MATVVDFEDIFDDAEHVLPPPAFPKDHYARANAPVYTSASAAAVTSSTATNSNSWMSSYIFTFFIATVLLVGVYWGHSWYNGVRRRQRDAFFRREHRRRHGIPDDDHRPWSEAYPDAQARRKAQLAARPAPKPTNIPSLIHSSSSYDPNGTTLMNLTTNERNAKIERQNYLQQEAARLEALAAKGQLFPGPLELNRQQSSAPSESQHHNRSPSPFRRNASPQRSNHWDGPWGADPEPARSFAQTNGTSATTGKGRKRLFMDPREENSASSQNVVNEEEDPAGPFSLPKRQRVNTWGANSQHATTGSKRAADEDDDTEPASSKRSRTTAMPKPAVRMNGSVPISRLRPSKLKGATVTFTPSTRGSSGSGGNSIPPPSSSTSTALKTNGVTAHAGQKRDRDDVESVADSDITSRPARKKGRENKSPRKSSKSSPRKEKDADKDVVLDPLCAGHKIGEIWESGPRRFKVGNDGRRLIAGMVRERRPKYHMPADSVHQDNTTMVDVVVEKWYTEEDYALAKAVGDFAWQDESSSSDPAPPKKAPRPKQARASSSFWDAPDSVLDTPSDGTGEVNPFARDSPMGPVRARVAVGSPSPMVHRGPRYSNSSRWQKQQKEAEALKKIQEAKRAQAEAAEAKAAASAPKFTAPVTTTSASPFAPSVSSPLAATSSSSFPAFGATAQPKATSTLAPPAPFNAPASGSSSSPGAAAPSPFNFASAPKPSASATSAPASGSGSSLFNFGAKPSEGAPKPAMPSFGSGSSAPSPFGAATKPAESNGAPAATPTSAAAPSPFSFGSKPSTPTASGPQPTTTPAFPSAPSFNGSAAPSPFGAASAPKPTGFNFGGGTATDAKRTESLSSVLSAGTTAVGGGASFGAPKPAESAPPTPTSTPSFSFGGGSGNGNGPAPAAQPSAFGGPSPFGAKPDGASSGFSLKGAANGFGATSNGTANGNGNGNGGSNGAANGFGSIAPGGFNKKWTNPDLAKKDAPTGAASTSNGQPKPNAFQTGPSEPPKSVFGGSGLFGGTPSAFGAQPAANGAAPGANGAATTTPSTWTPPAQNPFAAAPPFVAHRPSGAPPLTATRSRSRSQRPLTTRPPR